MAQFPAPPPSPSLSLNPVSIVGPQYCAPQPVDLAIVRKVMNITDGNFVVEDINNNGKVLFNLKEFLMAVLHNRRVLLDAAGAPIVTLREKIRSLHHRWQVFRGKSTDLNDLIFSAKKSEIIKSNLDVFLANNTEEHVCDFKVKGSWSKKSCVVYAGESDTIVAQMLDNTSTVQSLIGKDRFEVRVYTNIDHAFIITLIMILDAVSPLPPGVRTVTKLATGIDPSSLVS